MTDNKPRREVRGGPSNRSPDPIDAKPEEAALAVLSTPPKR
ncbi:MAG: hypothetical protein V6Z81_10660 [Parvularculales bacterium]